MWIFDKDTIYVYYKHFMHQVFGKHWWVETNNINQLIEPQQVCFFCRRINEKG